MYLFNLINIAYAQGLVAPKKIDAFKQDNGVGFVNFACVMASWVFAVAIILSIVTALLAAIKYMNSGGDPGKVKEATNMLIYTSIGIAVALIAFFFPTIISGIITEKISPVCASYI
jgi:hypothetical protein